MDPPALDELENSKGVSQTPLPKGTETVPLTASKHNGCVYISENAPETVCSSCLPVCLVLPQSVVAIATILQFLILHL